ncbi:transposable element Tcb2 transposase [Trichonephila clavipes]|nr:transposable element Tcb2 transposase [Trichonephila clavipes]
MPLRHFRRQYEQLSQFERGRSIQMIVAEWSARRVSHQLGRCDCVERRCWDQWIREMPFTRRPGSSDLDRPPHRKKCTRTANCFIVHHPGTGSTFIRGPCVFSRERDHDLRSWRPLRVLPLTPTHRRLHLEWCHARGNWTAAE